MLLDIPRRWPDFPIVTFPMLRSYLLSQTYTTIPNVPHVLHVQDYIYNTGVYPTHVSHVCNYMCMPCVLTYICYTRNTTVFLQCNTHKTPHMYYRCSTIGHALRHEQRYVSLLIKQTVLPTLAAILFIHVINRKVTLTATIEINQNSSNQVQRKVIILRQCLYRCECMVLRGVCVW